MTSDDFSVELAAQISRAEGQGRPHVEINAGELHRVVGGYPDAATHRMPQCCKAMRAAMREGRDTVVFAPPSGDGASLTVRYIFPR